MPDQKISAMPAAVSVGDADLVPIVQAGQNKRATVAQILDGVVTELDPTLTALAALPTLGSALQVIRTNAAGTAYEHADPAGGATSLPGFKSIFYAVDYSTTGYKLPMIYDPAEGRGFILLGYTASLDMVSASLGASQSPSIGFYSTPWDGVTQGIRTAIVSATSVSIGAPSTAIGSVAAGTVPHAIRSDAIGIRRALQLRVAVAATAPDTKTGYVIVWGIEYNWQ